MKKFLLSVLLLILIMFFAGLTIFRLGFYKEKPYYFTKIILKDNYENLLQTDMLDKDTYKDNIIMENILTTEYNYFHNSKSITGTIYIGENKSLYITDINENLTYEVSTIKFRTMYTKKYNYEDGLYVFLISEDNKLYFMELTDNDIKKAVVKEAYTSLKVINFVDLDFKGDIYKTANTLLVLSTDGNIYDATSGIRYDKTIKMLYNNIYAFSDNSIVNLWGKMYKDTNGKKYKLKYIFLTYDDNDFSGKNTILIITDDNKLLYLDDNFNRVYEFNVKVKDVMFNLNHPYLKGNLSITFEDDSYLNLNASCNEYYCVNEFDEN